jgi:hypothetical protein
MAYERFADLVQARMRMFHAYQPVVLVTLLPRMTDNLFWGTG